MEKKAQCPKLSDGMFKFDIGLKFTKNDHFCLIPIVTYVLLFYRPNMTAEIIDLSRFARSNNQLLKQFSEIFIFFGSFDFMLPHFTNQAYPCCSFLSVSCISSCLVSGKLRKLILILSICKAS